MQYEVIPILTDIKNFIFAPVVKDILAPCLAFLVGGLAGLVSFANDFTDKPLVILQSWPCHLYAAYSGTLALLTFKIVEILDIKILALSISAHPYILAALVGGGGYALVSAYLKTDTEEDKKLSKLLHILFHKIHTILYHQYGIIQNSKLRPDVSSIMHDVDDINVWEFSIKCIIQARGINEEKGNSLGESYKTYSESGMGLGAYKVEIGMDLAKIIGLDLLKQVSSEIKNSPNSVSDEIKELESLTEKLQCIRSKENNDGKN